MDKIKQYINQNRRLIVIWCISIIAWLLIISNMRTFGDDITYAKRICNKGLWIYYIEYVGLGKMATRFIIDLVLFILLRLPNYIYKAINIIITCGMIKAIESVPVSINKETKLIIAVCMTMMFPFYQQSTAGWMATTVTYWWSACMCIIAISILIQYVSKPAVAVQYKVLAIVAVIYGADGELGSVFLTVTLSALLLVAVLKHANKGLIISALIFSLLRVILHLVWESFGYRSERETMRFFSDYGTRNLPDKIQAGFSSTFYLLFKDEPLLLFVLCLTIMLITIAKHKSTVSMLIASFPLVLISIEGVFRSLCPPTFKFIGALENTYTGNYGISSYDNYYVKSGYILIFLWAVAAVCVIISLFNIFDYTEAIVCTGLLAAGMLSSMAMGFTPNIVASGSRTQAYLLMSVLGCGAYCLMKLCQICPKSRRAVILCIVILGGIYYLNDVLCISFI